MAKNDAKMEADLRATRGAMSNKKEELEGRDALIKKLSARLGKTKDAAIKAKIEAQMGAERTAYNTEKAAFDVAQKAYNTIAKQKVKLENDRRAKEQEAAKARALQDSKKAFEKVAGNVKELKERLADFQRMAKENANLDAAAVTKANSEIAKITKQLQGYEKSERAAKEKF